MPDPSRHRDPAEASCRHCGYDLRGTESAVCPECGRMQPTPLIFQDRVEFYRAKSLLEQHGLLIEVWEFGGFLGPFATALGSGHQRGVLWAPAEHLERINTMLEEAGVYSPIDALPIVDRRDPFCPFCHLEVNTRGRPRCASCGGVFDWVHVGDEPEIDPAGLLCQACGYDLTGNESKRCPECGNPLPADLDALVAKATAAIADELDDDDDDVRAQDVSFIAGIGRDLAGCACILPFVGAVIAGVASLTGNPYAIAYLVIFIPVALLWLLWRARPQRNRTRQGAEAEEGVG